MTVCDQAKARFGRETLNEFPHCVARNLDPGLAMNPFPHAAGRIQDDQGLSRQRTPVERKRRKQKNCAEESVL
jgi:hypothetical protein